MSNIQEVSINAYRRKLREAIENLPIIDRCFIYGGEFNADEENNNPSVTLSQNKAQIFLEFTMGSFVDNPAIKGTDLIANIRVWVAAKNDYNNPKNELRNESETCITAIYQIVELLFENKFDMNVVGFPDLQAVEQFDIGVRNQQRYTVYAFNFTQRINFYKKNKI